MYKKHGMYKNYEEYCYLVLEEEVCFVDIWGGFWNQITWSVNHFMRWLHSYAIFGELVEEVVSSIIPDI